jgi:predicted NAD/FAD-binding protein
LQADREFCVTLNHTAAIDPTKVIRTISYAHPVYTRAGNAAQARHSEISGHNRTHFCGAYWSWSFHEDGVASAVRVAERMGVGGIWCTARYTKVSSNTAASPSGHTNFATGSR